MCGVISWSIGIVELFVVACNLSTLWQDLKRVRMNVDNSRRAPTIGNIDSRSYQVMSRGNRVAECVGLSLVEFCISIS